MANEITTAKEQFRDALIDAGLDVKEYIPERVIPPMVVINSSEPFLTPESIGSEYTMALDLNLIAQTATNEQATEELEALMEQSILALPAYARLVNVGKPYSLVVNGGEYLSADMRVQISITI